MALILHIETATENASVCLSNDSAILAFEESTNQKNHASFLQPAIQRMFQQNNYRLSDIDAVSVSNGPGSYTGLRVGLSTAKGLCYALNKPIILINTLEIMAFAAMQTTAFHELIKNNSRSTILICPMIDARRMEVFTALYNIDLEVVEAPVAMILEEQSFEEELSKNTILFCGNGTLKFALNTPSINKIQDMSFFDARHLSTLAFKAYQISDFADLAYSEPYYVKAFYTIPKKLP